MKGISTIIATILMLLIVISLTGTAYVFFSGVLTGKTSKVIELLHAKGNIVVIRNSGTENITSGEIRVLADGREMVIENPQDIEAQTVVSLEIRYRSCLDILNLKTRNVVILGPSNAVNYMPSGSVSDGVYTIKPDTSEIDVYCDMTTDGGGYDFYVVMNGKDTYRSTDDNSCKDLGMDIWVPRSQAHWAAANSYGIPAGNPHVITGVTKPSNGCGGCTAYAMNSGVPEQSEWHAVDGGSWWFRDTTYSEPNGDYTANCWLYFYNLDPTNIRFNDGSCSYHSTNYLCSTNDKDPQLY